MLLFNTASDLNLSDVNMQTSNTAGIQIKTSIQKVDRQVQVSLLVMFRGVPVQSPILNVSIPKMGDDFQIRLPLHLMSCTSAVEIPTEVFRKNWDDLSFRANTFQKVDCILKNPAP
jgi:hypothetical protein